MGKAADCVVRRFAEKSNFGDVGQGVQVGQFCLQKRNVGGLRLRVN